MTNEKREEFMKVLKEILEENSAEYATMGRVMGRGSKEDE